MSDGARELLFSPATLLWLLGSAMAAMILLGTVNRRRSRLTESLRNYVDRSQSVSKPPEAKPPADDP